MPRPYRYRRSSLAFALLLIAIGALWLFANMHPGFDPWNLLFRYWPVILIVIGLGKLVDYFIDSHNMAKASAAAAAAGGNATTTIEAHSHAGEVLALVILIVLVFAALSHHSLKTQWRNASHAVDAQGAQTADVNITIPAGDLTLHGGAASGKIVEADFRYAAEDGEPKVDYSVSGGVGMLNLTQGDGSSLRFATGHNDWTFRLNNDIPSNLKIEIGAGHGDLDLHGLALTGLDLEMGAGQVNADLAANWKKDASVTIQGGVGQATLRLPENIGVEVHASGGLGAISTDGLHKRNDSYVNGEYGKSPVTLEVNVTGGVGQINLISEP